MSGHHRLSVRKVRDFCGADVQQQLLGDEPVSGFTDMDAVTCEKETRFARAALDEITLHWTVHIRHVPTGLALFEQPIRVTIERRAIAGMTALDLVKYRRRDVHDARTGRFH